MEIDLKTLKKLNLSVDQYIVLFLSYYKKFNEIKEFYGVSKAIEIRNSLVGTPYILSDSTTSFLDTAFSAKVIEKSFGIRSDNVNFHEFYIEYPLKVGNRVLRASKHTSQLYLKHEKKYLARVKTFEQHTMAIKSVQAFVARQKQSNSLKFLPNMETVLNNNMWEQWEVFINEVNENEWNNQEI